MHVYPVSLQFYRFIELQIRSCRSNGIDCKVRGLSIVARGKVPEEDFAADYPFLASENEEVLHCVITVHL